jgi:molecular chaperone GrpE
MEDQKNIDQPLQESEAKAQEYLNNWKRAAADFANYKKGEIERAVLLTGYAKEDMLYDILPVLDSIYLLEQHEQVEGIDLIKKQIDEFLKRQGIEEIVVEGKEFDPATMEAIGEIEENPSFAKASESTVVEVQKGYKIGEKVIRPARVNIKK